MFHVDGVLGLGAASSGVRPSASFRRRGRARAVAVRYAQRQALEILRMVEKPHLLVPPGLSLPCSSNGTILSGADNVAGSLVMITTRTPIAGSDLDIGTNITADETVPQDSNTIHSQTSPSEQITHVNGGVDRKSQMVPDDEITTSSPISYGGFLKNSDLARMRTASQGYCDIVAVMIGEKYDEGSHYLGNGINISTADNVTAPGGKRPPSKTSRPRWGSGSLSTATKPAPRRRPLPLQRKQRLVGLEAASGLTAPPSARLLHYEEWCGGCFEVVEVPIAMGCSYCECEARLIGICEQCRAVVCFSCIDAAGAAVG